MGSYGTGGLLLQANGRLLVFLLATLGSGYPTVAFHFSQSRVWLESSLHPEVRVDGLRRGGVELDRFVRFPTPMDLDPSAVLGFGINAIWECLVSRDDTMCGIVRNGTTAVPSKWVVFRFPHHHFGQMVSNSSFPLFAVSLGLWDKCTVPSKSSGLWDKCGLGMCCLS